ncbi:aquaporin-like protein [Aspergillus karnatakaensis]|uniref:aquaporin-like protein n=1 Tax=Aspergillus karnatakaensis TaxID=1810916 RepID=UPI003CCCAD45
MSPVLPISSSFWRPGQSKLAGSNGVVPFAGRIGANQEFSIHEDSSSQRELLEKVPDAAPWIPLKDALSMRPILQPELWKGAVVEAIGSCLFTFLSIFVSVGLNNMVGAFDSGPLVPGLVGAGTVVVALPLFVYSMGPVSGAHINPMITIATFFGRLATLPRAILYLSFQTFGAAVSGWILRESFGTRSFQVPGCFLDTNTMTLRRAFTIEFVTDFALIFFSFAVGLDPRQRDVYGPALGPILIGFAVAMCAFFTGITIPGYGGFSGNPGRCFAAMVGSHFESYHWIHWVGPLAASMAHGVLYYLLPPSTNTRPGVTPDCNS